MDPTTLQLFPPGGLDTSVITTVWVGVFVVAAFNLRFGWVLSGLVVPGYIVPLLISKPLAAGVIFFEAALTYAIVALLSGPLARIQGWSSFFGRDRFFTLVLVSVVVRLVLDGWLLIEFGEWLSDRHGLEFDYRNNLHSFGLVIIALIGNQFWKTGFLRGLYPLTVTIGLSYLVVRYGLMEFTNFRISGVSYMFEDVTASILAGPKAYIILLTTAFVASRLNLFYGWEFNGILIPSLLALQWYEPAKVLVSFLEAFLILGIGGALMRTPLLRDANVEGARKLLLFFNVAFAWKLLLGWSLVTFAPSVKISDYFAFGYLLSTLMAIKMHDKGIALRLTWSTLTTSAVAIVVASVIGFALTFMPSFGVDANELDEALAPRPMEAARLQDAIADEARRSYGAIGAWTPPIAAELEAFREGVRALAGVDALDDTAGLSRAVSALHRAGYELRIVEDRHLLLREREVRGWGTYVVTPGARADLVVGAPAPLHEAGVTDAALWLRAAVDARAFALGGPRRRLDRTRTVAVLADRNSPYLAFHAALDGFAHVHTRGRAPMSAAGEAGAGEAPDNIAWIDGALPEPLNLGALRDRIGGLEVRFRPAPERNVIRDDLATDHVELSLAATALRRMASGLVRTGGEVEIRETRQRIEGYLQDWLFGETRRIATRGSEAYIAPDLYELLFFDEEILTPLLGTLAEGYENGAWTPAGITALEDLSRRLRPFGYRLVRYRHLLTGTDYVILGMRSGGTRRYWGTYVLRAGEHAPYLVQVPRPEYESASFEFGVDLFERTRAAGLMIAGAHPYANLDGSSDVTRAANAQSLFSLVSQVVLREHTGPGLTIVQSRALGFSSERPLPDADVLVASHLGITSEAYLGEPIRALLEGLRADGFGLELVDGDASESGLEALNAFQARYVDATEGNDFLALWLAPFTRADFRRREDDLRLERDLELVDVRRSEASLAAWLEARERSAAGLSAEERRLFRRYAERRDIVALTELTRRGRLEVLMDVETRRPFVALADAGGDRIRAVATLAPAAEDALQEADPRDLVAEVSRFRSGRAGFLVFAEATP